MFKACLLGIFRCKWIFIKNKKPPNLSATTCHPPLKGGKDKMSNAQA